jgi:pimeloyl-ACP methyl ester carboxylesterase
VSGPWRPGLATVRGVAAQRVFVERSVRVADNPPVDLFVAQSGGPPNRPLLMVHGGPDWDHTYLRDPLLQLGGRYRLVMPDLRGCGRSTTGLPAHCYTPDAAAGDLLALGLSTVDVLGFSYGGLLAQRLAVRAPGRIRTLVTASSSTGPVPGDAYAHWPERTTRQAARSAAWADPTLDGPAQVRAAAIAGAPADIWRPSRLADYLDRLSQIRFGAEWARLWQAGILPPADLDDAPHALAQTGIPILLLHGAYDMTAPASLATAAAHQISTAHAAIIDNAGHMTHIDQPERWLHALENFLSHHQP